MHPSRKEQTPRKKMGGRRKRGYGGGDDLSLSFSLFSSIVSIHFGGGNPAESSHSLFPHSLLEQCMINPDITLHSLGTSSALGYLCQFPPFLEEQPSETFSRDDDDDLALFVGRSVMSKLRAVRGKLGEFWEHIAFFGLHRWDGINL